MDNSIADARTADVAVEMATMPRFEDGRINLQELPGRLAESVVNETMGAEADRLCEATKNSRNGRRERKLITCVGTLTPGTPKLRIGSLFPDDVLERYQRVGRAMVAAVAEMYATGTGTRKVQKIAGAMGIERLSKDQAGAIAASLDSEVEELLARPPGELRMPYPWLDATYLKRGREGRVASTAVAAAIGCDESGWRHVLGLGVVDTESYDPWPGFLKRIRDRGVEGVVLATSDAHEGLRRATRETFRGAAWQRCVVHIIRDCVREARSRRLRRRAAGTVGPVFRAKDAEVARAMYRLAAGMLEGCCPRAARIPEGAEPDALAHLDFPASRWKRLRANNVQERTSRETRRRSKVVQVFPSVKSPERLVGAVMCDQDDGWRESRYFSEKKMAELYDGRKRPVAEGRPSKERAAELRLMARKAIDAGLELADELGAA